MKNLTKLFLIFWVFFLFSFSAKSATILVETTDDVLGLDGACSLREALENANNNSSTYKDCTAGSGDDTIELKAGKTYLLTEGQLEIKDGATITVDDSVVGNAIIDADSKSRVFYIFGISDLVIFNYLTIQNGSAETPGTGSYAGGIYNRAPLEINYSNIINNKSLSNGGGIYNYGNKASLKINNFNFSGNSSGYGGGIYHGSFANLSIQDTTIGENYATNMGGGLYSYWSANSFEIKNSKIQNNKAEEYGGGIFGGTITITDSEISGNQVLSKYYGLGGGIYVQSTTNISSTTVKDNYAKNFGGGIYNDGDLAINEKSKISGNSSSSGGGIYNASFSNTIIKRSEISGNEAGSCAGMFFRCE